ncbi:MAG: NAD(P)/FAD-dependent oxidoreductase, partial [Bryobacteraceae bacterium]
MNRDSRSVEVLVVGAGPAGLAAACRASEGGKQVLLLDDNPAPGGQIWRQDAAKPAHGEAARWLKRLARTGVQSVTGTSVITGDAQARVLVAESADGVTEVRYEKLVLACGARELFLPFPGWTLPNVMGAGGLQAMVKGGLPIEGKRVVVAGTGPLLLAVAAYLRRRGAKIALIAEQVPWRALVGFGIRLARFPGKVAQSAGLRFGLRGIPYLPGCWIEEAMGGEKLEGVRLRRGSRQWEEPCDYLAIGYGLRPNSELAALLGCQVEHGATVVDELQQTSMAGIYCAGEMTGIGGVE